MNTNKPSLRKIALLLLALALPASATTLEPEYPDGNVSVPPAPVSSGNESFGEYEIKAGFIYRFLSFVAWPEDQPEGDVITIGILGKNPFGNAFDSIEGSKIGNRVIKIRCFGSDAGIEDLKKCQLLYISASIEKRLQEILKALEGSPALTIGDRGGFIDQGGMIGFVSRENEQVGIEINAAAASRARLTIRSMLKRIAVRIIDDP
ncbi:MAG TPA: hypothetical protein DCS43_08985 [Verrucomicrobia bacterium]|nr:hypothetical protein [Verrucomicrobiota bacterium]